MGVATTKRDPGFFGIITSFSRIIKHALICRSVYRNDGTAMVFVETLDGGRHPYRAIETLSYGGPALFKQRVYGIIGTLIGAL